VHTGNSSIHIAVDVSATDPKTGARKKTTRCLIVFVAVDTAGDTVQVPGWEPLTEDDLLLQKYAMHMAERRKEQEDELLAIDHQGKKPG
jgi:acyl-CoA hydrolase